MQQSTPSVVQLVLQHKELFGIFATSFGVVKNLSSAFQSRSLEFTRDKLLARIQTLTTVNQLVTSDACTRDERFLHLPKDIQSQLSDTLVAYAQNSQRLKDRQAFRAGKSFLRRFFLFYRPPTRRAWIPHLVCWFSMFGMPAVVIASIFPDDGGSPSFREFVDQWKDPVTIASFLFYVGLFLVFRLWAVWELKRKRALQQMPGARDPGIPAGSILAWVYAVIGLMFVIGAIVGAISDPSDKAGTIRIIVFGIITILCALPLSMWGKPGGWVHLSDGWKKSAAAIIPSFLMSITFLFNIGGVVEADFRGQLLAYWRNWFTDPVALILFISFAALPSLGTFRSLRSRGVPASKPA